MQNAKTDFYKGAAQLIDAYLSFDIKLLEAFIATSKKVFISGYLPKEFPQKTVGSGEIVKAVNWDQGISI